MRFRPRLPKRFRRRQPSSEYVCTLCHAAFDEPYVVCPKCRAYVVRADD